MHFGFKRCNFLLGLQTDCNEASWSHFFCLLLVFYVLNPSAKRRVENDWSFIFGWIYPSAFRFNRSTRVCKNNKYPCLTCLCTSSFTSSFPQRPKRDTKFCNRSTVRWRSSVVVLKYAQQGAAFSVWVVQQEGQTHKLQEHIEKMI